ncbi:MAG: GxxExxY protein [Candidatus Gracilibacteria bacterium]|nr:GxxExxY protein [Candidatus Gracilibacteria bacterium]
MNKEIVHKELSYKINGLCFKIHNELGRFCKEKQYADEFEKLLKAEKIAYEREIDARKINSDSPEGNRLDFLIENKIILEFKTKIMITRQDYYQIQRYLLGTKLQLGIIVNFRNAYLKPKRVLNKINAGLNSKDS